MSIFLKTAFSNIPELNFEITQEMLHDLESFVVYFETKNEHSLTLNSAIYGVHPIYFLNSDAQILFDICSTSFAECSAACLSKVG